MRRSATFLALLLLTSAPLVLFADSQALTAYDAWIREAPPGSDTTAAYMALENAGDEDVTLVHVGSPDFGRVEIHQTVTEDGRTRMEKLDGLEIPAESSVELAPGGKHLMLLEAREQPQAGQMLTLVLEFDDGSLLDLMMPVRQETGRDDHDHHHEDHEGDA